MNTAGPASSRSVEKNKSVPFYLLLLVNALLIDGLNLVRRVYAAVPGDEGTLEHFEGAVESMLGSIKRALNELAPTHVLCVFDAGGKTWRHEIYPGYKQERPPMPEALRLNLHRIQEVIEDLGVRSMSVPGVEADDVLATIAVKVAARNGRAVILSTDKKMCQVAGERILIRDHFAARDLDHEYVRQKFDVDPVQLTSLFALVGDKSLSVPGVKSIGVRTAARLIAEYGTLDEILANVENISGRPGTALRAEADRARTWFALMRLKTDVELGINLNELRWPPDPR